MLKKMATMAAALSLVVGGVAPAVAAQPLSLIDALSVRASAEMGESSELNGFGDEGMMIAALVGVALLIWGFTELLDDDIDLVQPIPPTPPNSP